MTQSFPSFQTDSSFGFHPTFELAPWLGGDVRIQERVVLCGSPRYGYVFQACELKAIDSYWPLRRDDPSLAVAVCSPGGASKSADYYDDYEYYSSADIFLRPKCFAASSFFVSVMVCVTTLLAFCRRLDARARSQSRQVTTASLVRPPLDIAGDVAVTAVDVGMQS